MSFRPNARGTRSNITNRATDRVSKAAMQTMDNLELLRFFGRMHRLIGQRGDIKYIGDMADQAEEVLLQRLNK